MQTAQPEFERQGLALHSSTLGLKKQPGESAFDVFLDLFREAHRRPGARVTVTTLDAHIGTDPAVAVAGSELIRAGYLIAPELTATGFGATQRGNYRNERASEVGR